MLHQPVERCGFELLGAIVDLSKQTALVTGGGRGIGRAIAHELARHGCKVAVVARTLAEVDDSAIAINSSGGHALALTVDVRDLPAVRHVATAVEDTLGPITLLVNNAGTGGPAGFEWDIDPDQWWECVESIVRGAFNCTAAVLPGMLGRGAGRVIDVASITGTTAWPLVSATSIAKTTLIRRVEGLASTCADHGVTVFALHPGMVRTRLLAGYRSNPTLAAFLDGAPEEAFVPPELAARLVARIATGELDSLSGRFLDATADLSELLRTPITNDTLTLRLVPPCALTDLS